jgi:DNA processing protein
LGDAALRKLLAALGSPERVLGARHAELRNFVSAEIASLICGGGNADATQQALTWLSDPANHAVTLGDTDYPQLLLQTADPPPLLYVKGRLDLLNHPALAVVGSRNATAQGTNNATDFARALSDAGITIVSGLALGIDAAAHRGGLAGPGSSVAVIGTGLDVVYPARNKALAHELAERGALVSEFPLGTPPLGSNFPRRNRLISGMSLGCLVVEAALQSGSLITARLANEQGREVFALPGSIHSPLAKGCHALIKQGAKLVDNANDILEELKLAAGSSATRDAPELDADQALLLDHLGYEPCGLDALCGRAGLGAEVVSGLLLKLELQGMVESLPGGRYQRVR